MRVVFYNAVFLSHRHFGKGNGSVDDRLQMRWDTVAIERKTEDYYVRRYELFEDLVLVVLLNASAVLNFPTAETARARLDLFGYNVDYFYLMVAAVRYALNKRVRQAHRVALLFGAAVQNKKFHICSVFLFNIPKIAAAVKIIIKKRRCG